MSSSSTTVMNRAADVPGWVVVVLSLVIVAITGVVAQRQATSAPTPSATSTSVSASASLSPVRRDVASRSSDRSRTATKQTVKQATPLVRKPTSTLPVASNDATQTVESAEASTYNTPGQCLNWSREQADIPSYYASAATAWLHATGRHSGDVNPPKGAAVYWTGGSSGYGHVAISVGQGKVRSSDAGGPGVVATVSLHRITREWGLTYAGWADSINGYTISGVAGA